MRRYVDYIGNLQRFWQSRDNKTERSEDSRTNPFRILCSKYNSDSLETEAEISSEMSEYIYILHGVLTPNTIVCVIQRVNGPTVERCSGIEPDYCCTTSYVLHVDSKLTAVNYWFIFPHCSTVPQWTRAPSLSRLHAHSQTLPHTVGLPWTSNRNIARDILPYNVQHSQETCMSPVVCEPAIPASERPQTHALDGADTGIGTL